MSKTSAYIEWIVWEGKRWKRAARDAEGAEPRLMVRNHDIGTLVTHKLTASEAARLVADLEETFDPDKAAPDGSGTPRQVEALARSMLRAEDEAILEELEARFGPNPPRS